MAATWLYGEGQGIAVLVCLAIWIVIARHEAIFMVWQPTLGDCFAIARNDHSVVTNNAANDPGADHGSHVSGADND